MQIKKGIPVSPGVAIAAAIVLDAEDAPIPWRQVAPALVEQEHQRLEQAIRESCDDLHNLRDQAETSLGLELARIFDFHIGLLNDKSLKQQFDKLIDDERVTAQYAVYAVMHDVARTYQQQSSHYFRERVSDIWDIERRVIGHLVGRTRAELTGLKQDAVVVAHDLTPSQTASLDRGKIKGIATDAGGQTSHTAILAHALGIPAIVGLETLAGEVNTGDTLIIDGNRGQVIINPDAAQLLEYRQFIERINAFERGLADQAQLPAETTDGTPIALHANIEFPEEVEGALGRGAEGVGLYRTEFLFLASENQPTEDEQVATYTQALEALGGRPLTFRTLDLGADKLVQGGLTESKERNPFLGLRSIRLCLQKPFVFKTQLRAILRASIKGEVRIMFPLICSVNELKQARMLLMDAMEELTEEGIPFAEHIPIGMMIEVPSAALQASVFAKHVDFFSIGTNDLVQYTVAVDRSNERIANLYSPAHPAVIQLIKDVVRAANRGKISVSLCGEMAGETEFVMLLLGLGLRSLSITPPAIPAVKNIIRMVSINQCQRLARRALSFETDREVLKFIRDELHRIAPELIEGRRLS